MESLLYRWDMCKHVQVFSFQINMLLELIGLGVGRGFIHSISLRVHSGMLYILN